ncbi:hypothetical protein ATCC90586_007857 [Pythium insidiosum]|nr:hypothetical protein ATCC90586_007857 [Pythium insidiosum]
MSSPLLAAELALSPPTLTLTPPLFEQTNIRKPEYWQFARLIAPAGSLPAGKKQWTADDAIGIWCLRCHKSLVFQKGSSQSIRYHMETKHRAELESFRETQTTKDHAFAATQQTPPKRRRIDDTDDDATQTSESQLTPAASDAVAVLHVDPASTTPVARHHDLPSVPSASVASISALPPTPTDIDAAALPSTDSRDASTATSSTTDWTWARNLQRRAGGFWADARWYDLHLERRMPLVKPMLEELVAALPPCSGRHVLDLCAGSGRASAALLAAYPTADVTLVDASAERLSIARQRILQQLGIHLTDAQLVHTRIVPELLSMLAVPSTSTVDVVIGCLAFHVLAERPTHYEGRDAAAATATADHSQTPTEAIYETLFRGVHALLQPGGHIVIADHVGQLGLYRHLALLERVGFEDLVPRERFASHVVAPRITADVLDDNGRGATTSNNAAAAMMLRRRQVIGGLHLQSADSKQGAAAAATAPRPSVLFSCQRLNVTVGGCAAFYSAVLSCAPESPVTISPGSLPTCLRVTPSLQIFTPDNWMTPQFFRVAALSSATYDDISSSSSASAKDERRRFLQIIEHYSSSSDARFNGNRLLYLPATLVVHVSPRDGTSVMASGRVLGTAQPMQPITKQIATGARNDFEPLVPEILQAGARGLLLSAATSSSNSQPVALVAKSSAMCSPHVAPGTTATASAAAVAAVEAANSATQHALTKRLQSRRNLLAVAPSGSGSEAGSSGSALATELLEGLYHSLAKDSQAFLKVVCRKNQTVLLHRNKQLVVLGKREGIALDSSASATPSPTASSPRLHRSPPSSRANNNVVAMDDDEESAADAALCNMVTDVDCGDDHIVAITEQGYLLTWGDGRVGQLGHGVRRSRRSPRLVQSLLHKRVVQVACGARHTFALAEDGDVYSWGYGKGGALGHSTSASGPEREEDGKSRNGMVDVVTSPLEVLTLKHRSVARIACGDMHTAVVLTNGTLLTCGWADQGRLGRPCGSPKSEYSSCFAPVDLKHRLCTFVACGGAHTLVLTDSKSLFAFGSNASGQLGVGDLRYRTAPTLVAYFDASHATITALAAGQRHSFVITQDARLFAWGSDEFGQCGLGSFPQIYTVPHLVQSTVGLGVVQVAGGDAHSVALCQAMPRHLDAMESNHPARYAALVERFESFVREDTARRAKVLASAKQRQLAIEEATRKKKPPLDPTILRGPGWQAKLECKTVQD